MMYDASMHEHVISAGEMNIAAALINQGRRYKKGHFSILASYNNNLKITPKTPNPPPLKKNKNPSHWNADAWMPFGPGWCHQPGPKAP